ncbi:MAG TPA: D-amino-acid transaminase [Rhizomicrobium sp.]
MQAPARHVWSDRAPPGRISYVNGRYLSHSNASVHVEDRGLQFADAVYEVFGVNGGCIVDEDEHFVRLERSLRELAMAIPMSRAALKLVVREIARRNRVEDGLIYLQITRGAFRRDHAIPDHPATRSSLILTARNTDMSAVEARRLAGISVVTGRDERWARCDIKSTSLLANVLAKTLAKRSGAYEIWLLDRDGFITEGSSTTAWIVDKSGRLITRDLSHAILPGVTRKVILKVAEEAQIPVIERRFTADEAANAREAFISAATIGAIPVTAIDGQPIGGGEPGAITRRVQELYRRAAGNSALRNDWP